MSTLYFGHTGVSLCALAGFPGLRPTWGTVTILVFTLLTWAGGRGSGVRREHAYRQLNRRQKVPPDPARIAERGTRKPAFNLAAND